jgi:UDP-N-acetylmuramate dehydrogenase
MAEAWADRSARILEPLAYEEPSGHAALGRSGLDCVSAPSLRAGGPRERVDIPLAELTTLGLGGPARRLIEAQSEEEVLEAVAAVDAAGEPLLVIAGGSNLVIADAGFDGTVLRILTRGAAVKGGGDRVELVAAAGEPWDDLVSRCVADGLAGIECLAGIPGFVGATPIQNVGAYGQQVADTIVSVRAYDRKARAVVELTGAQCAFAYRTSRFRRCARYVVLRVSFGLERSAVGRPVRYEQLARALGIEPGDTPPLLAVHGAVLALRRRKGMIIDPCDPDSRSAGSFFLNPVLSPEEFLAFERRLARRLGDQVRPPVWPEVDGRIKTSAAWLIERAGFYRGYGKGRVGISSKHTLALVNRGGASTAELLSLARELRGGVLEAFGLGLEPEPTLVGAAL